MVVPVPHQGQLPVPAGMLVPKVIKSPDFTPLPVTFDDIVTCELVVDIDETVVPAGIAPVAVLSRIVMPAVIWVVTTPLGNVRTFPDDVAENVGVPRSVTTAHGDPVLNSVAAVMLVFNDSVLVVVAALAVFETPE
jgi:hypothetical protein